MGNRDAAYVLNIAGSWDKSDDDEVNIKWARDCFEATRSCSTGGVYINFLTEEEGADQPLIRVPDDVQKFRLGAPLVVLELRGFPEELVPVRQRRLPGLIEFALDLLQGGRGGLTGGIAAVVGLFRGGSVVIPRGWSVFVVHHYLLFVPNISEMVRAT